MTAYLKSALSVLAAVGLMVQPQQAAAADGEDIARALAGLAAIAIIAKAADNRKEKKATSTTRSGRIGNFGSRDGQFDRFGSRDDRRIIDGRVLPYGQQARKTKRGYKKLALPRRCLRTVQTRAGSRPAYSSGCLSQSYKFARHLPRSCETLIRTRRGLQAVYGARCLQRDGWNVARR